jgi:hypothetical protein
MVDSMLRSVRQMITVCQKVELEPTFPPLGPYPVSNSFGYTVAIAMMVKSLDPGGYAQHLQFESIRKLRAMFSNMYMVLRLGTSSLRLFGGDTL